jgi:heptosyltransferase-1
MRVLIIKTSSLGDIVHTFPALTDATRAIKGIQFDWVVEEGFVQMPAWHPAVDQVIPNAIRRWRKALWRTWLLGDWKRFVQRLQAREYDVVIDAQGLIKSALVTRKALGPKHGLDKQSAREPLATRFYDHAYRIDRQQHAIQRTRQLFSQALGYSIDELPFQYGLSIAPDESVDKNTIIFLHGTTWSSKRWPMSFWSSLAKQVVDAGYQVLLPAGNDDEKSFAETLASEADSIKVLAGKSLSEIAAVIKAVSGVVSVDTGLAHLAAALEVPTVALYGATNAELTGVIGEQQVSLQASMDCSPCLQRTCKKLSDQTAAPPCTETLSATDIWQSLQEKL